MDKTDNNIQGSNSQRHACESTHASEESESSKAHKNTQGEQMQVSHKPFLFKKNVIMLEYLVKLLMMKNTE